MGKLIEVKVPDIGDFTDVPVIELLVAEGDTVDQDQALIVLESDKSTMEVPAPQAGVVRGLKVGLGDKVSKGDAICALEAEAEAESEGETREAQGDQAPVPDQSAKVAPADSAPEAVTPRKSDHQTPPASSPAPRIPVTVPDIGDFTEVPVIELLVAEGDTVDQDQALIVLESDKSTMEVPAPQAGVVRGLKAKVGDKLSKGDAICELETKSSGDGGEAGGDETSGPEQPAPVTPASVTPADSAPTDAAPRETDRLSSHSSPPSATSGAAAHAGPATRKFARELGVDLSRVKGSGPKGRVVIEDVQQHVKAQMTAPGAAAGAAPATAGIPPIPAQDFSKFGPVEEKPLARIRKLSAAHLHRSWLNVPHVTQHDEADITELEAFRKSAGADVKLTLLPFVIKAVGAAIRQFPEFGSSLAPSGEALILKHYCHIGFAADTPNGLVVPVVRDVWAKGIVELAAETAELARLARDGKLKPDQMRGGCFSISSLGGIGGSYFTPIVNAPEVGILGVSRGVIKPVWNGEAFAPRLMLPLSLSYDHRVIDGAYAARFIVALVTLLGDIRRLTL